MEARTVGSPREFPEDNEGSHETLPRSRRVRSNGRLLVRD